MVITYKSSVRDKIIDKGGTVSADMKVLEWTTVSLRITKEMIESIDVLLKQRIGTSRNAWILESIQQKIKKEKEENR